MEKNTFIESISIVHAFWVLGYRNHSYDQVPVPYMHEAGYWMVGITEVFILIIVLSYPYVHSNLSSKYQYVLGKSAAY